MEPDFFGFPCTICLARCFCPELEKLELGPAILEELEELKELEGPDFFDSRRLKASKSGLCGSGPWPPIMLVRPDPLQCNSSVVSTVPVSGIIWV